MKGTGIAVTIGYLQQWSCCNSEIVTKWPITTMRILYYEIIVII
jgi:hypothetical protein